MTEAQYQAFCNFRTAFKAKCAAWNEAYGAALMPLQRAASEKDTPAYPLETAVVYNRALDDITKESRITYIVIGDNPGKDEQRACNNRYLVGQSGKMAQGFFARNPEFNTDFRENVIILNKTPVHTAKTAHLRFLAKQGGDSIRSLIEESQVWMAQQTAFLHCALCEASDSSSPAPELWLVGYSEMKKKASFTLYKDVLKEAYAEYAQKHAARKNAWDFVYVYRHFSMNQFSTELNAYLKEQASADDECTAQLTPVQKALKCIGAQHKQEFFGTD